MKKKILLILLVMLLTVGSAASSCAAPTPKPVPTPAPAPTPAIVPVPTPGGKESVTGEKVVTPEEETTPPAEEGEIALTEELLEAAETELANIQTAVVAMMVDNELSELPNPVTVATNDMSAFPDTSVCGVDKIRGPTSTSLQERPSERNPYVREGDMDGYLLYQHDLVADGKSTDLVNYVAVRYTKGTYTVDAAGTVTQVTTGYRPADVYVYRGTTYSKKGEYDKAIADFDKAIELDPDHVEAYNSRGITYGKKGEYDKAIADFDKAIELDPTYARAYNNRGITHIMKGEETRAISDLEKCIELSNDPEVVKSAQELLDKLKQ